VIHVVDERAQVADLLVGADPIWPLVDEDLRTIAITAIAVRAWRTLVTTTVEDLVVLLGGDAGDVEQLRREGAMRRRA
jgi:hypothetical protein